MVEDAHELPQAQPTIGDEMPVSYSDETLLWSGRPSQWVNFIIYIVWSTALILGGVILFFWNNGLKLEYSQTIQQIVPILCCLLMLFSVLVIVYSYLTVANERTSISANKIEESSGIISIFRHKKYCEISDITDISSPPPGIIGLVGLAHVVIEAKDDDQPVIRIRAIRDRDKLIKLLMPVWRQLRMDRRAYFEES